MNKKIIALVVAAGRGLRAGAGTPKQYRDIAGKPMLRHTVDALLKHPSIDAVQVVIHADDSPDFTDTMQGLKTLDPVFGGTTRANSVLNGLEAIASQNPDIVLIHDAARPFIDENTISNVIDALGAEKGAVPCLPVVDALWRGDGSVETSENRENLWRAQTPQGFDFQTILQAHQTCAIAADDDVALLHHLNIPVAIVTGSERNFKITNPQDFDRAEGVLAQMDIRTGNGFDVHAFGAGDSVTLCGVEIPHSHGLVGHSDADVAMHTVTDAIFGALAKGDIGRWFPPSDPQWKGAASEIFLRKAVDLATKDGFNITHVDCTIICEMPKIGPHAAAMRAKMAEIMGLSVDRVSVKATTSERLGFTGRSEGIAAMATATLVKT